jgi:hypothetical protein
VTSSRVSLQSCLHMILFSQSINLVAECHTAEILMLSAYATECHHRCNAKMFLESMPYIDDIYTQNTTDLSVTIHAALNGGSTTYYMANRSLRIEGGTAASCANSDNQ